jgi:cytochrome c-type biogenesis protein CcmF
VIPTLGRALLFLGLGASAAAFSAGVIAGLRRSPEAARWTRNLTLVSAGAFTAATLLMVYALLVHDFSVTYVADVGSTTTPAIISVVSLWSSLEGSMLFWVFVAAAYAGFFAWRTRFDDPARVGWSLATQLVVLLFFALLVVGEATPFALVDPAPVEGPGPNPLLQNHILMAVHPPTLYLGYVGMSVPFGMAVAALATGKLDASWTRTMRAWSLFVWAFLTLGIILGGWWSYEVLGWGGYWAWDPVENASLLPWLTFTAFLHSLIVAQRRGHLPLTSLVLVIASFLLTMLGTFMTRSGVFNSVHSFTQSPIGPVFLGFLTLCLVGSVLLLAARMDKLEIEIGPKPRHIGLISRETGFLLADLVLIGFTVTVLLGTVYPLVNQAMTGEQVSVGGPYYEKMTLPLMAALLALMGIGPALPWGGASGPVLLRQLLPPALVAGVVVAIAFVMGLGNPWLFIFLALAAFATVVSLRELWAPIAAAVRRGEPMLIAPWKSLARAPQRTGAHLAHLGVVALAISIGFSTAFKQEAELSIELGQSTEWNGYTIGFLGADRLDEPHRTSTRAHLAVFEGRHDLGELVPALNKYPRMSQSMGSPAVISRIAEDLYVSAVRVTSDQVSIRVYVQPLVSWVWLGGILIVIGGLVAALPRLRRKDSKEREA